MLSHRVRYPPGADSAASLNLMPDTCHVLASELKLPGGVNYTSQMNDICMQHQEQVKLLSLR